MKLYEKVLQDHPSLFTQKDVAEITQMLAAQPDNKYLTAVVMGPYIENSPNKAREARVNYLVFMDEVENRNGVFARQDGETPYERLAWFYGGLTKNHPLYNLLTNGENGVRLRKNVPVVADNAPMGDTTQLTRDQWSAFDEIEKHDNPVEGFWWIEH